MLGTGSFSNNRVKLLNQNKSSLRRTIRGCNFRFAPTSVGVVYFDDSRGSKFCRCGWNPKYFPEVLSIYLTFESVDEILKCDHTNESYWAVFLVLTFWICRCGWDPEVWPLTRKVLSSESVDEIRRCVQWSDYWAVLWFWLLSLSVWMKSWNVTIQKEGVDFWVCGWNPEVRPFERRELTPQPMDEIL